MSQTQRGVEDGTNEHVPSVRLDLVEQSVCLWQATLTVDLPKGYRISVVLADEKIIEATAGRSPDKKMTFQFEMSEDNLSISLTDATGATVLVDRGHLHLSNMWNRKYAHAEVICETKQSHTCPCVVFMGNMEQLPDEIDEIAS
jgi:hypothetical protein